MLQAPERLVMRTLERGIDPEAGHWQFARLWWID
jgi:hypothetical protein